MASPVDAPMSGYEPRRLIRRVPFRPPTAWTMTTHGLASLALVPGYLAAAALAGGPGLRFHAEAARLACRLLAVKGRAVLGEAGRLALYPLDSTRYLEFDWVWTRLRALGAVRAYLDVSSPRLLPLCFARRREVGRTTFLNPHAEDLVVTRRWAEALGVVDRCEFLAEHAQSPALADRRFDVISSISVIEHVPDDTAALARLRAALAPGGTILLTLPCAAEGYDQYRDWDEYGLSQPDAEGRYFFQRFYDEASLRARVFAALGEPRRTRVYGEREPGCFGRNAARKMRGLPYPFWREPYMMARDFGVFPSIDALPGEGVVALEFTP